MVRAVWGLLLARAFALTVVAANGGVRMLI